MVRISMMLIAAALAAGARGAFEDGEKRLLHGEPPPHTVGMFRPFVLPGEISADDGFVEFRKGHGIAVWCPERLVRESSPKVAAARRFMETPFVPIGPVSVAYVGDETGEAVLSDLGVPHWTCRPENVWELSLRQVVVLGPGTAERFRSDAQVKALKDRIAARTLVVLPGADLALLPFGIAREMAELPPDGAGVRVPNLPLFMGIERDFRSFLDHAKGVKCPVVADGPAWMVATSPACIAHVKNRDVSIILLNIAPTSVPAAARPALTRVWCTILANINVESGTMLPALGKGNQERE